ncbi:MAG: hypothetical protein JO095_15755, partial [Alphaproteobacteria bacterium]|nr:hypothetical protein [Alphaproteobacteria bacterium]
MLAYHIMGSANPEHALRLLNWIYSAENSYLITFDSPTALERFKQASKRADNIEALYIPPVTWGGISMVASILTALRILLNANKKWSFFILLSDSDVPLKTQEYICMTLMAESDSGKDSFIHVNQERSTELDLSIIDYSVPYKYQELLSVRSD